MYTSVLFTVPVPACARGLTDPEATHFCYKTMNGRYNMYMLYIINKKLWQDSHELLPDTFSYTSPAVKQLKATQHNLQYHCMC